jgi:acyl-coenzyme A synthetase/AMP-(fatty) acid ligase
MVPTGRSRHRLTGNSAQPKVAIVFEADDGSVTKVTYKQLYHCVPVRQWSQITRIKPGDRVIIYMPMSVEVVIAMQACARIGATHWVFGGFSAKSLQESWTPARSRSSPPTAECAGARRFRSNRRWTRLSQWAGATPSNTS